MSEGMERVSMALRVSSDTKEKFEQSVESEYGFIRPYAGVQLEKEILTEVGETYLSEVMKILNSLLNDNESIKQTGMLDVNTSPNKKVQYRVHPDARKAVTKLQKQYGARSAGNVLEAIMFRYQSKGGIQQRIQRKAKRLQLIVQGGDRELLDGRFSSTPIAQHIQQEAVEAQAAELMNISEQLEQVANAIEDE